MPLSPHASSFTVKHNSSLSHRLPRHGGVEDDRQALHLQPVPVLGGPCDLVQVLSVRKFVAQLVRRLPQGAANLLSKASESLKIKQT